MDRYAIMSALLCTAAACWATEPALEDAEKIVAEAKTWVGASAEQGRRGRFVMTRRSTDDGDAYTLRLTEPIDALLWESLDGSIHPLGVRCEWLAGLGYSIVINGGRGAGSAYLAVVTIGEDGAHHLVFERGSKFGFELFDLDADGWPVFTLAPSARTR